MDKLTQAIKLLEHIGMPPEQQSTLCAFTLLAMAGLKKDSRWSEATNEWIRIHDVISFLAAHYDVIYAENSRETFRKKAMHHFRNAALIEDNGQATNSPNYRYRLTNEFLMAVKDWPDEEDVASEPGTALIQFMENHASLSEMYASKKKREKIPVRINHQAFTFSPGKHNELQKAILEEFAPRFAPNSICLYVGDTIQKDLVKDIETLASLGFEITLHDKMPDVVLYDEEREWIFFIESVTSVGPMDSKRILEISEMTENVKAGKIYITAFLDFATFKKFSQQLA